MKLPIVVGKLKLSLNQLSSPRTGSPVELLSQSGYHDKVQNVYWLLRIVGVIVFASLSLTLIHCSLSVPIRPNQSGCITIMQKRRRRRREEEEQGEKGKEEEEASASNRWRPLSFPLSSTCRVAYCF